MVDIEIAGDYRVALTYLAGLGLANICDEAGLGRCRLRWSDSDRPTTVVEAPLADSIADVGVAVVQHAQRELDPQNWMSIRLQDGKRMGVQVFSPRTTVATSFEDWQEHQVLRNMYFDRATLGGQWLDLAMLAGLGQPSHWDWSADEKQPDRGASRWEMKTRNRGEEIIANRLVKLASAVASRDAESVGKSLTGSQRVDELDGSANSRTSTGLTPPGPCDSVLAWCGLWGISNFPTIASAPSGRQSGASVSLGMYPRKATHPTRVALPVRQTSTSLARIRSVLLSPQFDVVSRAELSMKPVPTAAEVESAREWLTSRGFDVLLTYPVRKAGSASAPERQILPGSFVAL